MNQYLRFFELNHKVVFIFFLVYFLLGMTIFKHYGTYWDEARDIVTGMVSLNFIVHNDNTLFTYKDRYYGTAFQQILTIPIFLFKITDPFVIYQLRHLLVFLYFFISTIFFYLLCLNQFKNKWLSLLGVTFLIISPRIFADSFYNSKDIALLSAFIIGFYTLYCFIKKPNMFRAIIHSITCAFATDIRLVGLLIPFLTIIFMATEHQIRTKLLPLMIFIVFFCLFIILFWPFLWKNPIGNLIEAINFTRRFQYYDGLVLYFSKYIKSQDLPWHYIPVWISITTPLSYLILFLIGLLKIILNLLHNIKTTYVKNRILIFAVCWLFIPYLIILRSENELYDGWRHLYFIYPAIIILALFGFDTLIKFKYLKILKSFIALALFFNLLWVVRFMIINHPYQNLYFNELTLGMANARKNFDFDYWGLIFKKGLLYIAETDKNETIPVILLYGSAAHIEFFPEEVRKRFVQIYDTDKIAEAKYVLGNYRWHAEDYPYQKEVYNIKINGVRVLSVSKLKD